MKTFKVPSKSTPGTFREVRIKENIDGSETFECSCPSNLWYRMSKGRHGKAECLHISFVKNKL